MNTYYSGESKWEHADGFITGLHCLRLVSTICGLRLVSDIVVGIIKIIGGIVEVEGEVEGALTLKCSTTENRRAHGPR